MYVTKPLCLASTITVASLILLLDVGILCARPDRPHPDKPVPATDVMLVEKVTLRGKKPRAIGGGKRAAGAATGILGEPCLGTRYAILVGISDYPGSKNDLDYAAKDAQDMSYVLEFVYDFDYITVLTDRNANRKAILGAIADIEDNARPEDQVLFFFSGHGVTGIADDGDKEREDEGIGVWHFGFFSQIWDGELRQAFSGFQTDRIICIFDMCFAGGMNDLDGPGRVILMASAEKGYAYEGDEWENGEFTYYLKNGMGGEAKIYDYGMDAMSLDGSVTVEEAFDYTKANCVYGKPEIIDNFPYDLLP